MSLQPQPPPDAPAPPPGPEALRSRRKMKLIWWLGGISVAFPVLFGLLAPLFLKARRASERTEALNNIRQVGMALFEFDADYGRFPDASTIAEVKRRTSTPLTLTAASSNQLFRQLLVTGVKTEWPFYARIPGSRKPDDVFHSDVRALGKGECGFSYVAGLSSSSDPATPVVMTPMNRGTKTFDLKAKFGERAIVLRPDNSASAHVVRTTTSQAIATNGRDIFDPAQPYWHGKAPDLKWHE
jgi:hypothetical protein